MTDSGHPSDRIGADETSTPAGERPDNTSTPPPGATGDDIPDASPASAPAGVPADEATPAEAGAAAPDQATPEETPAPREPDPLRDPIVAQMIDVLGDAVVGSEVNRGDMTVRVANASWRTAVEWCKTQGFTYFCFLSGIDWLPDPDAATRYENTYAAAPTDEEAVAAEIQTGVAGGDTRFQVFCRLYDVDRKVGITLKADLDDTNPSVESITGVFRGADWHEREAWEMFGFDFPGHPGLRHLYLPSEFEGFPLRKDFPLLARAVKPWPGLVDKEPIPGEDEEAEASA